MKAAIVYQSIHQGNTVKLVRVISEVLSAETFFILVPGCKNPEQMETEDTRY